jgi:NTP pyrophosphatase (non-canonical NTP hydrolase)
MSPSEYIHAALRTEMSFDQYDEMAKRITDPKALRLLHAICGLVTEAGELMDTYKKYAIYGKPIDWVNVAEEIGDSQWYTALAVDVCGEVIPSTTWESILEQNIRKLKTRYPGKYSNDAALNRNLDAERKALEQ